MAGLLLAAGTCWAYPSLLGPTGGVNLPVADTVGQGRVEIGMDLLSNSTTSDYYTSDVLATRMLFGVSPNAEIGVSYHAQSASDNFDNDYFNNDQSFWGVNAKYVWPQEGTGTSFAIGGVYQQYSEDDTANVFQAYGVASQVFSHTSPTALGCRGSLGVNWSTDSNGDSAVRPFAILDLGFHGGVHLSGEYQARNSTFGDDQPIASAIMRIPLNPMRTVVGDIGLTNAYQGVYGDNKQHVMIGACVKFGG